jgi:hypothetical protein
MVDVKPEDFSVELVDATTKVPFTKFKDEKNGDIYYEVEPDAEYLVRVEIVGNRINPATMFRFDPMVDEKSIGYVKSASKDNGPQFYGVVHRSKGVETTKAFRFKVPSISSYTGTDVVPFHGTVSIPIHEAIFAGYIDAGDIKAPEEASVAVAPTMKKVLRSGEGRFLSSQDAGGTILSYQKGRKLQEIKVKYCTTIGLIHAGILPPPNNWSKADESDDDEFSSPAKKVKIGA